MGILTARRSRVGRKYSSVLAGMHDHPRVAAGLQRRMGMVMCSGTL
jgi:hypothetical protein